MKTTRWIAWIAGGAALATLAGCVVAPVGPPPARIYGPRYYGPPAAVVVPAPPPPPGYWYGRGYRYRY